MPPKAKGRPPKFVTGRDGRPVHGLSLHKSTGTFYATYSDPRVYFGTDFDRAYIEFRSWESRQKGATVTLTNPRNLEVVDSIQDDDEDEDGVTVALPPGADFDGDDAFEWIKANYDKLPEHAKQQIDSGKGGTVFVNRQSWSVPEEIVASLLRDILTDPVKQKYWSVKTGLPLDRFHEFKPPQPSPTLQSLIDLFADKAKITSDWRRKSKTFWAEFVKAVKATTVREVTPNSIAHYMDVVLSENQSPTYAKHRFGLVKRVFNFGRQRGIAPNEMRTALDNCAILIPPKGNGTDPHPISIAHMDALLKVDDLKFRAALLCSLNFCMYPSEVKEIEKSEIDLERKTLVTKRSKTTVTRVAVLWDRTVDAIRAYQAAEPHRSPYLFVSDNGDKYHHDHLQRTFRRRRKKAGVPDSVQYCHIRDGAYSAAIEGGADLLHAKLLAGHETGISDHYLKRNPRMVADAVAAIERHYFGATTTTAEQPKAEQPTTTKGNPKKGGKK